MKKLYFKILLVFLSAFALLACSSNLTPGPDKQGQGVLSGAATGAGAGAVTGLHLDAGMGPGAVVGAGFGMIAGGIKGYMQDQMEEDMLELQARARLEREIAYAHETLAEHFKRRIELHPSRDIYPADWFFEGDSADLRKDAAILVQEIARLNKKRFPWSRLVVASYVKTKDKDSEYAQHLAMNRSRELGNFLVKYGIEPRRIDARAVLVDAPVLIDPQDDPRRYSQAIELIPVDR